MKKISILCTALFICLFSFGQNQNEGMYQELKKVPVAPSPNVSALGKFGEIPVSMNTGIPTISIPFFSYADKMKGLNLNISLNYHAGGHKVEDMASNTGLGWALNAGGVISRTMRSRPDDGTYGYLNTDALPAFNPSNFDSRSPNSQGVCYENSNQFYTVKNVAESQLDGECDIFNINIGNISGKFYFKKNGEIQLISQSNLKITCTYANSGQYNIDEFIVTDSYGIKYIFNQKETTVVSSALGDIPPVMPSYTSAWYISKIISADGQDEIRFTYTGSADLFMEGGFSESHKSGYIAYYPTELYVADYSSFTQTFNFIEILGSKHVSSINFPDSSQVLFSYGFSRQDYAGDSALTEVRVKNGTTEKKFVLSYSYFESDECDYPYSNCTPPIAYSPNNFYKRLKLVSVQESDGTKTLAPYTFDYNSTKLPVRNSKAQDWWGFYNGIGGDGSPGVTPATTLYPATTIYSGDRPPSLQNTLAWVLEKMYYPTGGNTRFFYELNEGYNDTAYRKIGGLRVAKTQDFEPATQKISTTYYTYKKTDNTSSGSLQTIPVHTAYWTIHYYNATGDPYMVPYNIYHLNETLNPSQTLSYFNGSPVIYTRVKVERNDGETSLGYSVYEYRSFAGVKAHDDFFPFLQKQDYEWQQGLLLKESHYNSSSAIIKSVENEYQDFVSYTNETTTLTRNLIAGLVYTDDLGTTLKYIYGARSYYMTYGRSELKKTTERTYSTSSTYAENVTQYTYDNQYFVPTLTKVKNSKQDTIENRIYYPFNYSTTGFTNKTSMLNANRVAEPISQETWLKNGNTYYLKDARVNDYSVFNSTMLKQNKVILLETTAPIIQSTVGTFNQDNLTRSSAFKEQLQYTAFDSRGRYTDATMRGLFKYAFFWGRSNNYPVCTVKNATSSQIAYTSFEEDGTASWQGINSSYVVSSKGVTGKRYYQQSSFSISCNGLTSGSKYIVSYWSKNGAYTVSGTQSGWPKTGKTNTVNGQSWTYYEHLVTGYTTITVSSSGTGAIDELRLYPEKAEISTVAYNVLTGLTEQADTKDNIVYYEYDNFFRLHIVRDYQGNILKSICYNYQNQVEDCAGITTTAIWQPTGSVRCKACPANSSYYSDQQEREEKDMNSSSSTYNQTRWVATGSSSACTAPAAWTAISVYCQQTSGQNTGYQVTVQTDLNPCSLTYNQTKTTTALNQASCPPPGCSGCTGNDKKCISSNCETGAKVYTASVYNSGTGMYDCTYHYEWSDSTWSQDYVEQSGGECPVW